MRLGGFAYFVRVLQTGCSHFVSQAFRLVAHCCLVQGATATSNLSPQFFDALIKWRVSSHRLPG